MGESTAEAHGHITIRPWRVGLLVDTNSSAEVRQAIAKLSSVWGGYFMPILDINTPLDEIERLGAQYDVDSIYADVRDGALGELLRMPGWDWGGRGPWGPFGEEHGFRKGLLPLRAVLSQDAVIAQPIWDSSDPSDLVFSALWGLSDELTLQGDEPTKIPDLRLTSVAEVVRTESAHRAGVIEATRLHVRACVRHYLDPYEGLVIIRRSSPEDVVKFWNCRTYGTSLVGVPDDGNAETVRALAKHAVKTLAADATGESGGLPSISVWGLDLAGDQVRIALAEEAVTQGVRLVGRALTDWPDYVFQGVETPFARTARGDFRPTADWVELPLPELPLHDEVDSYSRGVVAADVHMRRVTGQDPRATASLPPFRRHSQLLKRASALEGVDQARVTTEGQTWGVDASRDHVPYAFASNLEVFKLLFDDDEVVVSQSKVGRFQSRAAEKFSGPFSGVFNQPGVRAAVMLAAGEREGIALPHLREVLERDSGDWPGPFSQLSGSDYARHALDRLLHAGLFVPTLRVHCSHCRVERWVSADELKATMVCEFCGEAFNLALSHSLTQPTWHYRLAAHLQPKQVQALLPALATTALIHQFRHVEEPPLAHVLGLEVVLGDRKIEVDLAIYLPDYDWTALVGEVKGANRIDAIDVENLELIEKRLRAKGVRTLPLFATLKEQFSKVETAVLRSRVERSVLVASRSGALLPAMPLVLTGPDLSHPADSSDHPWRWDTNNYSGIQGTAITSCQRNLGMVDFQVNRDGSIRCAWSDSPDS